MTAALKDAPPAYGALVLQDLSAWAVQDGDIGRNGRVTSHQENHYPALDAFDGALLNMLPP
ncbi:hypothetical protein [Porphyrobacter sp. HT-58-2]|jgi:hypothetical protein|uniref:hypothetical protein n=1 Tax=Porphyrobacter sp. HT-58-2 TaxID=2023229 RepID=UPI0011B09DB6|nr:hypothetical protein [Porphyrobacter sp. HT-58-2]